MNLGSKIDDYLKKNGIKQIYLSIKTGISKSKISLGLKGKRTFSITEYQQICWALGVGVDEFIKPEPPSFVG